MNVEELNLWPCVLTIGFPSSPNSRFTVENAAVAKGKGIAGSGAVAQQPKQRQGSLAETWTEGAARYSHIKT